MNRFEVSFFDGPQALADATASEWLKELRSVPESSAAYCVALSGGRIAQQFFTAVSRQAASMPLWGRVHFFWADERCVEPTDPESNFGLAQRLLLVPLGLNDARVHRIRGEEPPDFAALEAESELCKIAAPGPQSQPVLNLVFLGMGENGHVASLFPRENEAAVASKAVYRPVTANKPPPRRITIGYPALAAATKVWVLVSGEGKTEALRESLRPEGTTPLARVLGMRERTRIFSDVRI
jgi:6-phosphogluconolactonase